MTLVCPVLFINRFSILAGTECQEIFALHALTSNKYHFLLLLEDRIFPELLAFRVTILIFKELKRNCHDNDKLPPWPKLCWAALPATRRGKLGKVFSPLGSLPSHLTDTKIKFPVFPGVSLLGETGYHHIQQLLWGRLDFSADGALESLQRLLFIWSLVPSAAPALFKVVCLYLVLLINYHNSTQQHRLFQLVFSQLFHCFEP